MIIRHLPASCHPGRKLRSVDGAVIHFISDRYRHPDDPFSIDNIYDLMVELGLSYHRIYPREGEPVEFVPPELEAWHAGKSRLNGRDYCNRFTRGYALVGMPGVEYTDSQIIYLAQDTAQDMTQHMYTTDDIAGHDAVREAWNQAHPSKRAKPKPDPGELFPWSQYFEMLEGTDMTVRAKL